jgi:predicted transcriptional regulator
MRRIAALLFVSAVVVTGFAASRSHAQESQGIMPALLVEIRGLRAAMEQMAAAGPRVQLALGRLQLQEQRLNTLIMKLDATRENLARAQRQLAQHQQQMTLLETSLKDAPNTEEREQANHMIAMMKGEAAASLADVQRLTGEEASTAADIAMEQGRWNDFNQRLEELERTLGRR